MTASSSVTWRAANGGGTARHEAVLRLHRLHFVEKRGNDAVQEVVEARRKECSVQDGRQVKKHFDKLQQMHDTLDHKIKHAITTGGSFSIRSKEERDRMEEARHDPNEALEKMKGHMKELGRNYMEHKKALTEKVNAKPPMTFRSKEERLQMEEARQDPNEAREAAQNHMKELARKFKEQKAELTGRVRARPKSTFRTKDERDRMEELRQDPDEAAEKMTKHMSELAHSYNKEKTIMQERVQARPRQTFRAREERDRIEELRTDPDEAREKKTKEMRELAKSYNGQKTEMTERVRALPKVNIRPKEERDRIEEARQDPEEARLKMTSHMQDRALTYRAEKQELLRRVHEAPAQTFRVPEEQRRVEEKQQKRRAKSARR